MYMYVCIFYFRQHGPRNKQTDKRTSGQDRQTKKQTQATVNTTQHYSNAQLSYCYSFSIEMKCNSVVGYFMYLNYMKPNCNSKIILRRRATKVQLLENRNEFFSFTCLRAWTTMRFLSNFMEPQTSVAIACYFILLYCMAAFVNH